MQLKHIDLEAGRIIQDARHVRTKFSKSFPTYFVNIGGNARAIVEDWVTFLKHDSLWGLDDPLFPATRVVSGTDRQFHVEGLERKGWSNAAPVRKIFRDAFAAAELTYSHPHTFRKTLAQLGERICRTAEEFKAFSQNIGHDDVLTTFTSYGAVPVERQAEIIRSLGIQKPDGADDATLAGEIMELISRRKSA